MSSADRDAAYDQGSEPDVLGGSPARGPEPARKDGSSFGSDTERGQTLLAGNVTPAPHAAKVHAAGMAGGKRPGLRCRLGCHKPERQELVEHPLRFGVAFTNAICGRCGKQMWWNWPVTP